MKFVLEMVENIVGKGENAGYQHFLVFPTSFQKASFSKVGIVSYRVHECVRLIREIIPLSLEK